MIKDLVKANRSVRGYDHSYKVKEEDLIDLVDCARLTASSINKQPLKYYIADSEEDVAVLRSSTRLGALLPNRKLPDKGKEPTAYIVILQDKKISESYFAFGNDVGIAAQTITLAATEKGLSACMIGNINEERIQLALNLPDRYRIRLVIAIGKSAEEIHLVEIDNGENTAYYRDENDVHYVPKRKLNDIIINKEV